jgi:hypothetical protein
MNQAASFSGAIMAQMHKAIQPKKFDRGALYQGTTGRPGIYPRQ